MRKYILMAAAALLGVTACDYLETKPKDTLTADLYFRDETDLQLFSNTFYNNLLDKEPYDHQSDHYVNLNLSNELHGGNFRVVPATGGGWSWSDLRKMNTLLANMDKCDDQAAVDKYTGVTKFFRAFFYFEKVKRFGDVPWIETELGSADEQLYAPRDSRELVMSKMLEDIDEAIAKLPEDVTPYRVNKWTALTLKAEFCLFEGTFRKYHGISLDGHSYEDYLRLAAEAAKAVIDGGRYKLAKDYLTLFAEEDADASEYILAIKNDKGLGIYNNCTAFANMPTQGCPGLTKKFVDSFLMKDGSRFTDKPGWETMEFKEEVADRDPRLACCMKTPGYKRIGGTQVVAPDLSSSSTGFQLVKFVMDCTLTGVDRVEMSYNDMPVYRYAEVLLIYAEALAELGDIKQTDLDISVNLLRDRVGMPRMNLTQANQNPDWYLKSEQYGYRNVTGANQGIILEIRRERSIELAEEGYRYEDLIRWREGKCIEQEMYGMYFPGPGEYDLTGDGVADVCLYTGDIAPTSSVKEIVMLKIGEKTSGILLSDGNKGYIDPQQGIQHVWDEERDYYYPVPSKERQLNPNLTQNSGWNDGLSF
ncbi:MAG: RagB/SusD family nutrient uptake outer membrane protein [Bacteroidales bacterium]|nr:RagB/SusD family nutrient uptake outer membrane protein [Bacteroidales bacterium]